MVRLALVEIRCFVHFCDSDTPSEAASGNRITRDGPRASCDHSVEDPSVLSNVGISCQKAKQKEREIWTTLYVVLSAFLAALKLNK